MFYLNNKLFYGILFKATCLFICQPIFSQGNKNILQAALPAIKDDHSPMKPNANIQGFPSVINSKLNRDSSISLADFIKKNLPDLYICSGEVYFSGAGFPYVQIILIVPCGPGVSAGRKISNAIKSLLPRCRAGSEITFVKCSFQNIDGGIAEPVNRTVLIQ